MLLVFRELNTLEDMLLQYDLIKVMYPDYSKDDYHQMLLEMLPNNYFQLVASLHGEPQGLLGFWINTKLWSGKYIEIDHFIIAPQNRSSGIGKQMLDYMMLKAQKLDCKLVTLDCYTTNFEAQKFFFNNGFIPKGFHFIRKV